VSTSEQIFGNDRSTGCEHRMFALMSIFFTSDLKLFSIVDFDFKWRCIFLSFAFLFLQENLDVFHLASAPLNFTTERH
jgi:hypothetical protein